MVLILILLLLVRVGTFTMKTFALLFFSFLPGVDNITYSYRVLAKKKFGFRIRTYVVIVAEKLCFK